ELSVMAQGGCEMRPGRGRIRQAERSAKMLDRLGISPASHEERSDLRLQLRHLVVDGETSLVLRERLLRLIEPFIASSHREQHERMILENFRGDLEIGQSLLKSPHGDE